MATKKHKRGGPMTEGQKTLAEIREMREDVEFIAYQANYFQVMGEKERARQYFDKLKRIFARADEPKYADEDARYDLQKIAARERKQAISDGRRRISKNRRERVAAKRSKRVPIATMQSAVR
jgi:hypothetical protein